ncbi:hypothetical protein L1987_26595 [Smallanthus sonchifolius]|uniref:Uncharacterized protein n=1 Tax=Smallanthus sonchifolius TaxID=185202 RepID=A0ACB9IAI9_9ASTR|nr:hypothetical protein L1987_26595 [Smallanthus sonchifolius]
MMLIKELEQVDLQVHYQKTTSSIPENHKSDTGMKRCELCNHRARIYCQSDNASLCYDCDQNVHSSNFLVAKHSRTLLCHKCQSPTPWTASGLNLGRAATVCVTCLDEDSSQRRMTSHRENDVVEENRDVHEDGETDDENTGSSDDDSEDEDEDAENQVVPWSSVASPPAPVIASSSSEEFSSSRVSSDGFRSTTDRERIDAYIDSEDDTVCSSERSNGKRSTEISLTSFRPLKVIRSDRN